MDRILLLLILVVNLANVYGIAQVSKSVTIVRNNQKVTQKQVVGCYQSLYKEQMADAKTSMLIQASMDPIVLRKAQQKLALESAFNAFSLKSNSPAIDKGVDVGLKEDILGHPVPQGKAPDIGAVEYYIDPPKGLLLEK